MVSLWVLILLHFGQTFIFTRFFAVFCRFSVFSQKERTPRPQVLVYGDDAGAKEVAGLLIRDIGFDPLEAGPLRTARFAEPFAMVTAELAYSQPGGPALTYRFEKLRG